MKGLIWLYCKRCKRYIKSKGRTVTVHYCQPSDQEVSKSTKEKGIR